MASGLRISVEETWRGDALTGWEHMEVWDVFQVQREQLTVWVDALTELVLGSPPPPQATLWGVFLGTSVEAEEKTD